MTARPAGMGRPAAAGTLTALLIAGCGANPRLLTQAPPGAPSPGPRAPAAAADSADPFRDVAATAGVTLKLEPQKRPIRILESVGSGCGFLDYNEDGFLDCLVVGWPRCALYQGDGKGRFTDVTRQAGLDAEGTWIGCAVGDYDRDGHSDLLLTAYQKLALYRNDGKGHYTDVTRGAGIQMDHWNTVAAFMDFDRDGFLDLYVGSYVKFGPESKQYCQLHQSGLQSACRPFDYDAQPGKCFRNRGNGTFEDVTKRWGLAASHGKTLGIAVSDYDRDGWPDFYLANDEVACDLFHNDKGRGFSSVGVELGVAYSGEGSVMGGMGTDWGDYDNDGWMDLLVGTHEAEQKCLFRNQKGQAFEFVSQQTQVMLPTLPEVVFGLLMFDYDDDGWLDLVFVNGHTMDNIEKVKPTSTYRQPMVLLHNRGNGTFETVKSPTLEAGIVGRGVACGDYDGDGDLDLLVTDMDGPTRLLENRTPPGRHWLEVQTRGKKSNPEGFGARVTVTVAGQKRIAEISPSRSYASVCDPRAHFGLGTAAKVDLLEVAWPSGARTTLRNVAADRVVAVTEGE